MIGARWCFCSAAGRRRLFHVLARRNRSRRAAGPKPPVFIDVPEMLVNLSPMPGERAQYLKVKIVLEVKDQPLPRRSSRPCRA